MLVHNRYRSAMPSGENTVVRDEASLLADAGVEVHLYERDSDEIPQLALREKLTLPTRPIYNPRAIKELENQLRIARPQVVHIHNLYPLISPWMIRVAKRHGIPVAMSIHNHRLVCVKGTYFRAGHECHECRWKRIPWPAIVHGCYRESRPQSLVMAAGLATHKGSWEMVDRFFALTDNMADFLRADVGVPPQKVIIKPNSVADPGRAAAVGEGLLFLGRLDEGKGIRLLLKAWQTTDLNALGTLTIAGDGPLRDLVIDAARQRPDVKYAGLLDQSSIYQYLESNAALIVPSILPEAFPRVIVESLAKGRPVMVTSLGAMPSIIDSNSGWVVPPTLDGLTAGLRMAAATATSMSAGARFRYESCFSPEIVISTLVHTYEALLAEAS